MGWSVFHWNRALNQLAAHKEELEGHLKDRLGEPFGLGRDLLCDVTGAYFHGEAERNGLAQRGYSHDDRPDCKQVTIALVVNGAAAGLPVLRREPL